MKKVIIVCMALSGLTGATGLVNVAHTSAFAGEGQIITHEEGSHKGVALPIRRFTREMEQRTSNVLEGILLGDFDYVKQEADEIVKVGSKIMKNFFPQDNWYLKEKEYDQNQRKAMKADFKKYMEKINVQIQEVKKAADSNSLEATLHAFVGLVEKTCLDCHKNYRK